MPGFNQRGPMNEGSMTGRGQGICGSKVDPRQGFSQRNDMEYGMGRRCRRGQAQTVGKGLGYTQRAAYETATVFDEKGTLEERAQRLETELMALKNQIKNLSEVER